MKGEALNGDAAAILDFYYLSKEMFLISRQQIF